LSEFLAELRSGVLSFAREQVEALILGFFLLLCFQSARLWWARRAAGFRVGRHRRLGKAGEKRARELLRQEGYRLCSEQKGGSYRLLVDGAETPIYLRSDYLVERRGRRFVAEVKSGVESVKVTSRDTRRQLLEYLLAFDVDGVLLVDMQAWRIREVSFPEIRNR
jgi:hypothetical protein